jgi:hypothetical protein
VASFMMLSCSAQARRQACPPSTQAIRAWLTVNGPKPAFPCLGPLAAC